MPPRALMGLARAFDLVPKKMLAMRRPNQRAANYAHLDCTDFGCFA
jgi:hypothetical protein